MCSNFPVEPVCPTWYSFCSGCFPWLLEAKCNHPNWEWTMAKSYYGCFRKWCKLVLQIHTCNICLFTSIRSRTTLYLFKDIMFFLSNIILYVCIIAYLTKSFLRSYAFHDIYIYIYIDTHAYISVIKAGILSYLVWFS